MTVDHEQLDKVAWLMDRSVPLPFGMRIGLDGLLGLVPGFGDAAGSLVSVWLIYQAHKAGAPAGLLTRMAANVALDFAVGSIPIVGDLFDFAFKANTRNLKLLREYGRS